MALGWMWMWMALASAPAAAEDDGCVVIVEVSGIRNTDGHMRGALYDKANGFPTEPKSSLQSVETTIEAGKAVLKFAAVPPGTYAVATMHDENDNLKMDFRLFVIPAEGFGVSNNVKSKFGPPSFEAATFQLTEPGETRLQIDMIYL